MRLRMEDSRKLAPEGDFNAYLAVLRDDGLSCIFAGADRKDIARDPDDVLCDSFGATPVLLEDGGVLNGAFPRARRRVANAVNAAFEKASPTLLGFDLTTTTATLQNLQAKAEA